MSTEYSQHLGPSAQDFSQSYSSEFGRGQISPTEAAVQFLRDYSRERPETVAMWAFGIGFILGWKMKPW